MSRHPRSVAHACLKDLVLSRFRKLPSTVGDRPWPCSGRRLKYLPLCTIVYSAVQRHAYVAQSPAAHLSASCHEANGVMRREPKLKNLAYTVAAATT